ncbi:hypothetical protein NKH52_16155 [Mesorhizobium sp. M1066]|jgi:hypothetical protein|uniref:hypothetical protein n=1 Tax=unclassified Mesorhizobium TaxID=325217 RepID=UPI00333553D0
MRAGIPKAGDADATLSRDCLNFFSTAILALRDQFDAWHLIFDVESHVDRPTDGFGASIDALLAVSPVGIARAVEEIATGFIVGMRSWPLHPLLTVNTSRC